MNQNEVPRTEWSESDVAAMRDRTWEPLFDQIIKKWYVTDGGLCLMTPTTGMPFDPTGEKTCRAVCEDHNAAVRARKAEKTCSARKHAAMRKDGWAQCRDCGQSTLTQEVDAPEPDPRWPRVDRVAGDVALLRLPISLCAAEALTDFIHKAYGDGYVIQGEPMGWAKVTKMGTPT